MFRWVSGSAGRRIGRSLWYPVVAVVLVSTVSLFAPSASRDAHAQAGGTDAWEETGSLSIARYDHTLTLLTGGKVLAAAGRQGVSTDAPVGIVTSAELYNPHNGKWRETGPLGTARWSHTATLLPDGRVLVAGGFGRPYRPGSNAQPVLGSAEIYDPATGTWTPTESLTVRRALHTATLLPDGRVLVAGGRTCAQPPPAACDYTSTTRTAEIYDPATGTWSMTDPLHVDRHATSAALLPTGKVLVPAGFSGSGPARESAELYDPDSGTWSLTGPLNDSRARQGAMLLDDGRVLVAAGFPFRTSSELYDPTSGSWRLTDEVAVGGRFNFDTAVLPNGKALIAGGAVPFEGATDTAEVYDPATAEWTSTEAMPNEHGWGGSLSRTQPAVVLSSSPWRFAAHPRACAPNCGKVLIAGDNPDGAADLYVPTCPARMPEPPQQLACRDHQGSGNSGRPAPSGQAADRSGVTGRPDRPPGR